MQMENAYLRSSLLAWASEIQRWVCVHMHKHALQDMFERKVGRLMSFVGFKGKRKDAVRKSGIVRVIICEEEVEVVSLMSYVEGGLNSASVWSLPFSL